MLSNFGFNFNLRHYGLADGECRPVTVYVGKVFFWPFWYPKFKTGMRNKYGRWGCSHWDQTVAWGKRIAKEIEMGLAKADAYLYIEFADVSKKLARAKADVETERSDFERMVAQLNMLTKVGINTPKTPPQTPKHPPNTP
jgi:hypothetical protein